MSGILSAFIGRVAGVVTDAYFNLVTLLLPGNGTNGAQNNTFLDSSTNNFTITRNGNTTQGTFSPFSQTGWSNYFNGTTDYLSSSHPAMNATWTIEAWIYRNAGNVNQCITMLNNGGFSGIFVYISSSNYLTVNDGVNAVGSFTNTVIPINTWTHIAIVRSGGTTTGYVNGSVAGSNTFTPQTVSAARIGFYHGGDPMYFNGYISNYRVVNGTAVYTSAFNPPVTPLTAITNTSLLTCQSNRFIDNSSNAYTLTLQGTPSVQAFSPFAPQFQWTPSVIGGSGYFDGSGDQLVAPSNTALAMGTGDFQIEFWAYHTSIPAGFTYIDTRPTGTNGSYITLGYNNSGNGIFLYVNAMLISTGITPVANSWTHFVLSRVGSTTRLFRNGSQIGSATDGTNYAIGAQGMGIGGNTITADNYFPGYISGFRVVKGSGVTSVTVPTAPPTAITNTSLLLNFTNAGITDATAKNVLETVGNAQISTTQSKFGGSSMYFDGTGDYAYAVSSAANSALGSGDWTVEFWLYTNVGSTTYNVIDWRPFATQGAYFSFYLNSGVPTYYTSSADRIVGGSAIPATTWTHVAISRSGTSTRMFINGTQSGSTYTDSANYLGSLNRPAIGGGGSDTGNTLNGYIDDVRITRYARYTSNFTVPSSAFPLQ